MEVLKSFSEQIHFFVKQNFAEGFILFGQIALKMLLLFSIFFLIDFVLRVFTIIISKIILKFSKNEFLKYAFKARLYSSISHLLSLGITYFLIEDIFWRHPKSFAYIDRLLLFGQVLVFAIMAYRIVKALENYYVDKQDQYRITAIRAISETFRVFGLVIFTIIAIFVIFGISFSVIITILGAVTAIILLVFRDTILGFVTGIHVSTSKNLKIGDWIGIPKYNIEGNIQDINLLTTKIQNFDKTISTIPTYDLMSTEIRNHQVMYEGSSRRIKRSVYFNIKSFTFVDEVFYDKVKDINLISEYLNRKLNEIAESKKGIQHADRLINGQQLTNIGLFRNYVLNYLKNNSKIDQDEIILVRQLEITPQGLPLEIYCFANKAELVDYERIQADIFDHILTAAKEFDLEVMQVNKV
jgi:miniconductance mechanosensitive channel